MDTKSVVARFEAERQALAMMDHPNIAKVLDAGKTEGRLSSRPEAGDKNVAAPIPAGRPYFVMELMASGIDAMRKTIREKEPARPSTKLSQTLVAADVRRLKSASSEKPISQEEVRASSRRLLQTKETITLLRSDLDWIVMRCLEKDRTRRYESANGLATDLKRHLNNEPVVARPPSTAYRFQKAFRRNKLIFTAAGVVVASVFLGLTASIWMFLREPAAKSEADAARSEEFRQRQAAEANEQIARQAEHKANAERGRALQATEDLRRHTYVAEMGVVHQAIREGNLARARHLLDRHRPKAGASDLRGFEWRYLWQLAQGDARQVLGNYGASMGALALSRWAVSGLQIRVRERCQDSGSGVQQGDNNAAHRRSGWGTEVFSGRHPAGRDGERIKLWNVESRQEIFTLHLGERNPTRLSFSSDGRHLVSHDPYQVFTAPSWEDIAAVEAKEKTVANPR